MTADKKGPQLDENGRDPKLIDDFERFICTWAGLPFNVEFVPRGITVADWWSKIMRPAADKMERNIGTKAECWELAKHALGLDLAVSAFMKSLIDVRGPEDAFVREMRKVLDVETKLYE